MIRNQDTHELQQGAIEIKDGSASNWLAVTGSKDHEPSVTLTPIGENVNLNTFVTSPFQWGSIKIPLKNGVTTYDLLETWIEKNTGLLYDAAP